MPDFKYLQRNVFNEKIVHRYLFEKYYFGSLAERRALLPERFHTYTMNAIVPENRSEDKTYCADFVLYFKQLTIGIPVEVKWSSHQLKSPNQINYLRQHNGVLISFDGRRTIPGIDSVVIQYADFLKWFSHNSTKLARQSIAEQARIQESAAGIQTWVVLLRGTAHANFQKMLQFHAKHPFWAFTTDPKSMPNILDMQKGDQCLFILGNVGNAMSFGKEKKDKRLPMKVRAWYSTTITDPYYMVLKGERAQFFEDPSRVIMNYRHWPHFMSFRITESERAPASSPFQFGQIGEFTEVFYHSIVAGRGTPVLLSARQRDTLIDRLRNCSLPPRDY